MLKFNMHAYIKNVACSSSSLFCGRTISIKSRQLCRYCSTLMTLITLHETTSKIALKIMRDRTMYFRIGNIAYANSSFFGGSSSSNMNFSDI